MMNAAENRVSYSPTLASINSANLRAVVLSQMLPQLAIVSLHESQLVWYGKPVGTTFRPSDEATNDFFKSRWITYTLKLLAIDFAVNP